MIKFTFEESELFNSLFEGEDPILTPNPNIRPKAIDMLYSLMSGNDDSNFTFVAVSLINKLRSMDDLSFEVLISNLPSDPLTVICG